MAAITSCTYIIVSIKNSKARFGYFLTTVGFRDKFMFTCARHDRWRGGCIYRHNSAYSATEYYGIWGGGGGRDAIVCRRRRPWGMTATCVYFTFFRKIPRREESIKKQKKSQNTKRKNKRKKRNIQTVTQVSGGECIVDGGGADVPLSVFWIPKKKEKKTHDVQPRGAKFVNKTVRPSSSSFSYAFHTTEHVSGRLARDNGWDVSRCLLLRVCIYRI